MSKDTVVRESSARLKTWEGDMHEQRWQRGAAQYISSSLDAKERILTWILKAVESH